MQRDATRQLISILRQQQPAVRRGIISRKPGELFVEALKAETEAKRLRILEEEPTRLGHLGRRISQQVLRGARAGGSRTVGMGVGGVRHAQARGIPILGEIIGVAPETVPTRKL